MAEPRPKPSATDWAIFAVLLVGALCMSGPFLWMLSTSLKPAAEVFKFPPILLSQTPQPENYLRIFSTIPFGRAIANSLIVAGSVTVLQLIVCSMAAYAFSCLRFRGREVVFLIYLSALMVPSQVTLIPNFMLVRDLGWIDTYQGLILPYAFSSFGTFLLRQYMKTIPPELIEAARIDGAGPVRTLWRIILPISRPILAVVSILAVVAAWKDFIWPLLVFPDTEKQTLSVMLQRVAIDLPLNVLVAGMVLASLPMVALFLAFQRQILAGLTAGSLKG